VQVNIEKRRCAQLAEEVKRTKEQSLAVASLSPYLPEGCCCCCQCSCW
jgi:hypothetical protein